MAGRTQPEIIKIPRRMGRPTKYTDKLADKICAQLASGDSMRTVAKADKMPSMATIFSWLRTKPDFLERYTRAKEESADALIEEMMDIADDGSNDWMVAHRKDDSEAWQLNGEHVQRSRLRVDTRKWVASKLKPKKYGDRIETTLSGEVKLKHDVSNLTDEELDAVITKHA